MGYKGLGTVVAEFAPSKENKNPRNSEGAFLGRKDGSILFVYSRFKGEACDDWVSADIYAVTSKDGGRSFADERMLFSCEGEKAQNIIGPKWQKAARPAFI